VAALIAFVGTIPLAGVSWALAPILLIPLLAGLWAARAGTDVYPEELRVRALFGTTTVPWSRISELAPDARGRVSALLDNGNVIRLTAVTRSNLAAVIAAGGQDVSVPVDDPVDQGLPGDETP